MAAAKRPGLFDPCPCGSGKRFHSCCKPLGAAAWDPDQLVALAVQSHNTGQAAAAGELYRKALKLDGTHKGALFNLAVLKSSLGAHDEAIKGFRKVLESDPDDLGALLHLGADLGNLGRPDEALPCFERAVILRPGDARLWCNLGLACVQVKRIARAREAIAKAAELAPGTAPVLVHQGLLAGVEGDLAEAESKLRAALRLEENTQWLSALAGVLNDKGSPEATTQLLADYVRTHPSDDFMRFELASHLLLVGSLAEGWRYYDYRAGVLPLGRRGPGKSRPEAWRDKRVVVLREQGIGDQLFLLRFVPQFRALARPATLAFISEPKLESIVRRIPGVDDVLPAGRGDEPDFLLGDLPVLVASGEAVPAQRIAAQAEARTRASQMLEAAGPGPYLGVTWKAGLPRPDRRGGLGANDVHKRVPPESLGAALARWPGTVISLQRQPRDEDRAAFEQGLGRGVADFGALNEDLETMLALLELLDEYAGVSNANMHLRAAAGRTARVLVTRPYDWRWMISGDESPWFPGFRLYRQDRREDWAEALKRLADELAAGVARLP